MPASQNSSTKVISVRVKEDIWDGVCIRAEILGLKNQEVIEVALKSYLIIPIDTELNARKEGEAAFYNSLHGLKPKRSKDLQV
ncbi:MAG: hypothetical protein ACKN9F_08690 [Methylomonas sp.]